MRLSEMKKYKIKYRIWPGEYTKAQLEADNGDSGGCDEMMICSYVEQPDGGGSYLWMSNNGKPGEEMGADRQFKCFFMLAGMLAENENLGPGRRQFCSQVVEAIRSVIKSTHE